MHSFSFSRIIVPVLFCSFIAISYPSTNALAAPAKKKVSTKVQASQPETQESVQKAFEKFASDKLDSFNRTTLHSQRNKNVVKNADGTFTASYTHFNKETIHCSYKDAINPEKGVKYIGHFSYNQEEYQCKAPSEKAALAGPFTKSIVSPVSELAKYKGGKWSY